MIKKYINVTINRALYLEKGLNILEEVEKEGRSLGVMRWWEQVIWNRRDSCGTRCGQVWLIHTGEPT